MNVPFGRGNLQFKFSDIVCKEAIVNLADTYLKMYICVLEFMQD